MHMTEGERCPPHLDNAWGILQRSNTHFYSDVGSGMSSSSYWAGKWWFGASHFFLLQLLFLLSSRDFKPALPELKGIISFYLCIKFDYWSFYYYLFYFEFFFFSYIPRYLISFHFHIKFGHYSCDCYLFCFESFS